MHVVHYTYMRKYYNSEVNLQILTALTHFEHVMA
jgi:hypothetical protein